MAGKGSVFKNDVLKLILNATPIAADEPLYLAAHG